MNLDQKHPVKAIQDAAFEGVKKRLAAPYYTSFNKHGYMDAVYCKKCGAQIRGLKDVGNGLAVLGVLANYTEVAIQCDDGSTHVTNCCIECSKGLSTQDLQDFLVADTDGMVREARVANTPMKQEHFEMIALRSAVKRVA